MLDLGQTEQLLHLVFDWCVIATLQSLVKSLDHLIHGAIDMRQLKVGQCFPEVRLGEFRVDLNGRLTVLDRFVELLYLDVDLGPY